MAEPITRCDIDAGITKSDTPEGITVYMRKRRPGLYQTADGKELDEATAERAGFPVAELRRERQRQERRAAAMAQIDAELGMAPAGPAAPADPNADPAAHGDGDGDPGRDERIARGEPLPGDFRPLERLRSVTDLLKRAADPNTR